MIRKPMPNLDKNTFPQLSENGFRWLDLIRNYTYDLKEYTVNVDLPNLGGILSSILNTEISLLYGTIVHVKLSAGSACAVHITASTEIKFLIDKALEAMSQAKREGGNQVTTVFV